MKNARNSNIPSGLSLVELIVVLMILAATAAMVVPLIDNPRITTATGEAKTPEQIATEATMQKIRDVIMGSDNHQGVWADLGQRPDLFPRNPDYLLLEYGSLVSVAPEYSGIDQFHPVTKLGWRGPYLVAHSNVGDAWGNDILIQVDFDGNGVVDRGEARYARLVSAGPNQIYETALDDGMVPGDNVPDSELGLTECGDDIVLFFRVPDTRQ